MDRRQWDRQPGESAKAYSAFCAYYQMPAHERSIDAAWRRARNQQGTSNHASGTWTGWASKFSWAARALAHDEHLAEQDRLLWEERRRQLRQRDWSQADEIRRIVDDALPHADQFIRRQHTVIPARGGQPEREIVTLAFDINGLVRALVDASKLQRLATDEPTDNINLSGAALDAAISRELARLVDGGQAGDAGPAAEAGAGEDDGPTD